MAFVEFALLATLFSCLNTTVQGITVIIDLELENVSNGLFPV